MSKSRKQRDLDEFPEPESLDRAVAGVLLPAAPGKTQISIRMDDDVLEWFRSEAQRTGGSYQAAMITALREHVLQQSGALERVLRRVLREELDRSANRKAS